MDIVEHVWVIIGNGQKEIVMDQTKQLNEAITSIYSISIKITEIVNDIQYHITNHLDDMNQSYDCVCDKEVMNQLDATQSFVHFIPTNDKLTIEVHATCGEYLNLGVYLIILQANLHKMVLNVMLENPDTIADYPEEYKYFKSIL